MKVNWDDYSQYMGKQKNMFPTTNQKRYPLVNQHVAIEKIATWSFTVDLHIQNGDCLQLCWFGHRVTLGYVLR